MEILILLSVGSLCVMAMGAVACCFYLFVPRYEHRNPMLGQVDERIDSRFEKLWNKRQDEIEARACIERVNSEFLAGRCTCNRPDEVVACPEHPRVQVENVTGSGYAP